MRTPCPCLPGVCFLMLLGAQVHAADNLPVRLLRVPDGGIQPQAAVDQRGTLHLIYFRGEPAAGDVFYVQSDDQGATFSRPMRANSQPGSAVSAGTIRGAQMALGKDRRVHVAWNGSSKAQPKGPRNPAQPAGSPFNGLPMLYTRLNDAGIAFAPQRNLMLRTFALDGGGSVAADGNGNVYVAWHGSSLDSPEGEGGRRVWIARSADQGKTFAPEEPAYDEATGACGCCGMRIFADSRGETYVLYRSAQANINRDIYLLTSAGGARAFDGTPLHRWQVQQCPMSSMALAEAPPGVLAAWETTGQIYFGVIDPNSRRISQTVAAPGPAQGRKHPSMAADASGNTILVWTEGTGWAKGGSLAWQVYDKAGRPAKQRGRSEGIPVWSFAAAAAMPDGGFIIIY